MHTGKYSYLEMGTIEESNMGSQFEKEAHQMNSSIRCIYKENEMHLLILTLLTPRCSEHTIVGKDLTS